MLFEKFRPRQFTPAPRRLTEELWQKSIIHPREDRHIGAIFSSTLGPIAATTAQPITAFGLSPEGRADLDSDSHTVSRIVKYVAGVLAIDPAPIRRRSWVICLNMLTPPRSPRFLAPTPRACPRRRPCASRRSVRSFRRALYRGYGP